MPYFIEHWFWTRSVIWTNCGPCLGNQQLENACPPAVCGGWVLRTSTKRLQASRTASSIETTPLYEFHKIITMLHPIWNCVVIVSESCCKLIWLFLSFSFQKPKGLFSDSKSLWWTIIVNGFSRNSTRQLKQKFFLAFCKLYLIISLLSLWNQSENGPKPNS